MVTVTGGWGGGGGQGGITKVRPGPIKKQSHTFWHNDTSKLIVKVSYSLRKFGEVFAVLV